MKKELEALISILKKAGYDSHADDVKRITLKVDPLTFAVSEGLLNPSVLEVLFEQGHDEDLADFKETLEELQNEKGQED